MRVNDYLESEIEEKVKAPPKKQFANYTRYREPAIDELTPYRQAMVNYFYGNDVGTVYAAEGVAYQRPKKELLELWHQKMLTM